MLKIGSLELRYPIIQSPMAGCTDLAFRLLARRRGMEFSFLEMISANGLLHDSHNTHELMKTVPEDRPLGAQLVGCEPDVMAEAATRIEDMGFDLLDLNLGCPVRKITTQGAGSALLKDPKGAEALFRSVVKAVKRIPVTIKIRKGYEDDSGREAAEIARIAEDCGIAAVTVHGRTRAQGYTGKADWQAIGLVKKAVKSIPVIGNGDVLTGKDAKRLHEVSGCDGIMIGRGGLGNPWIYQAIRSELYQNRPFEAPSLEERRRTAIEHMELEAQFEGDDRALFHMRRIGSWYIEGVPNAAYWRSQLNKTKSLDEVRVLLNKALSEENAPGAFGAHEPATPAAPPAPAG